MNCPTVPIRLIRGSGRHDHAEAEIILSRVPFLGEMVPWPGTTEPCIVETVMHYDLNASPVAAACEVR